MITTSGAPRHLLRWSIVAVALLVGYLAGLVLLGLAARPGPELPGRLAAYEDPRAWWPIAVQVGLGAAAFLAYWWPRRRENRSFSFLVTGSLAVTTIGLGLISYWGCATDQSPFWTPLTWALNLIVGGVNDSCGYPLGLQVARLFGPLLLVITGLGVLATLFRNQRDRLSVRLRPSGTGRGGARAPRPLGLIRRLTESAGPRTAVAVLTMSTDIALIRSARDHGGAVDRGRSRRCTRGLHGPVDRRAAVQGAGCLSDVGRIRHRQPSVGPAAPARLRIGCSVSPVRSSRRGSWCGSTTPGRPSTGDGATATGHVPTTGGRGSATPSAATR